MSVEVRRARGESDLRRLRALFVEYEADLPEELRHGSVPDLATLQAAYERRDAAFLAERDGEPLGCVAVAQLNAATALLLRLFVQPQRRGLGAARSLVTVAIAFAKRRGYRRIVLDTEKRQLVAAYSVYRSLGFAECDPFTTVTYECPTFMELRFE
jgi:GNAT superfamily N-acetyltransferase